MAALKLRRKRTKYHITAPRLSQSIDREHENDFQMDLASVSLLPTAVPIPNEFMSKQPFVGLEDTKCEAPDTQKQLKVPTNNMKKKDKRKQRHDRWMEKIEACRRANEERKAAEKRKKTVIVGDLQPLLSALSDIECNPSNKKKKNQQHLNQRKKESKPTIYKEREIFKQVLSDPFFKKDPFGTIRQHLQNVISMNQL